MIRTYRDALEHLSHTTNYERWPPQRAGRRRWNLVRMRRLMAALGHPERRLRAVHIAGTKGKGTVAHLLDSMLRAAGASTGLYTSPHLEDLLERIRIDGRPLPRGRFAQLMARMEPHLLRVRPTFFETMTAAALLAFQGVDWAVLEVGLGGGLDATNVVRPRLCILTVIGMDHMEYLGDTIESIAWEKAGILKPGVPALTVEVLGPAASVIRRRARAVGAPLEVVPGGMPELAAGAARRLGVPERAIRLGLRRARIPGRCEVRGRGPVLLLDVAHTPESVAAFAGRALEMPARHRWLIFGASADKQVEAMLRLAAGAFDTVVLTQAAHPRAASVEDLGRLARGLGLRNVFGCRPCSRALEWVVKRARPRDLVGVSGSFYVAGEISAAWRRWTKSRSFRRL